MDIVGLGLATLDVLIKLRQMPTWERPGSFSAFALEGGGPVGTACAAAARLGATVGFVGTAGKDEIGKMKLDSLSSRGVDVSRVAVREGPESQIVLVYVNEETGERVFSGVRGFRDRPLQPEELDRAYITSAQYLHLDGAHSQAALQAARWMHMAGKTVMLDGATTRGPVSADMRALVAESDLLICGAGFGQALTGRDELWEAGKAILDLGPRLVVQTEGARGSYTLTQQERFHTPAFEVPVVDTTGAGDVFHGAYLVGLLRGWEARQIAVFASAVSALKCVHLGGRSGIPCFEEALLFLAERGFSLST